MIHRKAVILRAVDVARHELPWEQRLNPRSKFSGSPLSRIAGLERVGVSRGRIPPGGEAFAYHAHAREEEWIYIVEGRAKLRVDGAEVELGAGDFAAFPAPQPPHLLTNPFQAECLYLMGGERIAGPDVLEYPDLGERVRREALRHLVCIVAAIYPTLTYGDNVAKWGGGDALRAATNAHREALWKHMEAGARGPWFLGARWSVLDVYIAVMTNWRPNPPWFREMAPKLAAIAT